MTRKISMPWELRDKARQRPLERFGIRQQSEIIRSIFDKGFGTICKKRVGKLGEINDVSRSTTAGGAGAHNPRFGSFGCHSDRHSPARPPSSETAKSGAQTEAIVISVGVGLGFRAARPQTYRPAFVG